VRSRFNLPLFVGYALLSLAVLGYLATQMGGQFLLQPTYRVTAVFAGGAQLVTSDDVTISGVRVGSLQSLEPAPDGARAVLQIAPRYAPLYRDARAMVKSKNLLGEAYVELSRGTAPSGPMPDGGVLDRGHTLTPVELSQVLDVLDPDTRQRLVLLINNLGEAVQGRGSDLNASTSDLRSVALSLETIARAVAARDGDLDTLIPSLRKVLDTLAAWHSQLRQLVGDWDRLMRELASRETDLQGLFVQEDRVMAILDAALSPNARPLHDTIALAPHLLGETDAYTSDAQVAFGQITPLTADVTALFYELASVMSGTDAQGNHEWRIMPVSGGAGTLSAGGAGQPTPAQPAPAAGGAGR
jgi:phospholipid/cholesterol/gamma-HCH transport system substrate-binding protein